MPAPNISIGQLAVGIRAAADIETSMLDPTLATAIAQIASGATPIINAYAGANTPQDTVNLALLLFVGAVYDAAPGRRNMEHFFVVSGARAMLAPWHVPQSGAVR